MRLGGEPVRRLAGGSALAKKAHSNGASGEMSPRERMLAAVKGQPTDRRAVGNVVSGATYEQMLESGHKFPEVHLNAEEMAGLAELTYTKLRYDTVMPYFSIIQGAAALGAKTDWGGDPWLMDDKGKLVSGPRMPGCEQPAAWSKLEDINIPDDFLDKPATKTVIDAVRILRERYPDVAAERGSRAGRALLTRRRSGPMLRAEGSTRQHSVAREAG